MHGALSPLEAAEFATRVGAAQVPAAGNPVFADSSAEVPPPAGLSPELTPVPPSVSGQNHASGDGLPAGADKSGQFKLREAFVNDAPQVLADLRGACHVFLKSDEEARLPHMLGMYRRVHSLTGNAAAAGFGKVASMAGAFEALLKELQERPRNITASSLRTVAHAVDCLGELFEQTNSQPADPSAPPLVLVVDDDVISRRALGAALERAKLKAIHLDDPGAAYKVCAENRFDLIFLDVDMPGMNGFELCEKLRKSAANKTTPVVFVTNLTDFESRALSALSGGNDLIGKPFLLTELAVKALTYVLKGQMNSSRRGAIAAQAA